jgi:hypothetical protein
VVRLSKFCAGQSFELQKTALRFFLVPSLRLGSGKTKRQRSRTTLEIIAVQQIAIMAEGSGGIDRKAEERMEFTTSKDVNVVPTFSDMHLKGNNTYGLPYIACMLTRTREPSPRHLCIWI